MNALFKGTLNGKVALVTGAGSGIGKATAMLFGHAGARVAVLTRNQQEAEETCKEIRRAKGDALAVTADVSDSGLVAKGIEAISGAWGRLDIVVANAGINGLWAAIEDIGDEDWENVMNVNLKGTFLTVKHSVPLLKKNGGAIVIVSSVNGTRMFSNSGASAYASTKAAQVAFGRMMALELAKFCIRVNTICPGAIDTSIDDNTTQQDLEKVREPVEFPEGQIPLTGGKSGKASQVAELAWFLSSDISTHITGTEVFIDGAQSLLQG
jgi:NAD(P)-dependent dehydrogenase (short-subunit alcohol dehydrogenase family)